MFLLDLPLAGMLVECVTMGTPMGGASGVPEGRPFSLATSNCSVPASALLLFAGEDNHHTYIIVRKEETNISCQVGL